MIVSSLPLQTPGGEGMFNTCTPEQITDSAASAVTKRVRIKTPFESIALELKLRRDLKAKDPWHFMIAAVLTQFEPPP